MKRFFTTTNLCLAFLFLFILETKAQPNIDASITANEYGTGNAYTYISGGQTWYLTWDNTYLYAAVMSANQTETATIYLDIDPLTLVNGGNNSNGSLSGASFDGTTPNLPFRADVALFAKNSYRQISQKNGSGGFTNLHSGNGAFSGTGDDYGAGAVAFHDNFNGTSGDDRREFRVAWTQMGLAGKPTSFNFLCYMTYGTGVYSTVPSENPASSGTPNMVRYFTVTSTAVADNPFTKNSYTHIGGGVSIGSIAVYDFTMNTSSTTINRSGGAWTITNLKIGNGTISGNPSDDISIIGNLSIESGATLALSTTSGSDLYIGGDFSNSGTFTDNSRAVFFNGSNGIQTISGSTATTFSYLLVDKASGGGNLRLANHITVNNELDIDAGTNTTDIDLNGFNITLGASAILREDLTNNKIIKDQTATSEYNKGGYVEFTRTVTTSATELAGAGLAVFRTGGSDYAVTVRRYHYTPSGNVIGVGNRGIRKIYKISGTPSGITNIHISYATDELGTVTTPDMIYRWSSGDGWKKATEAPNNMTVSIVGNQIRAVGTLASFSDWTIGADTSPLPITLVAFTAEKIGDTKTMLTWKTASEINNKGFEVQKSFDGQHFQALGFVDGLGNNQTIKSYTFVDEKLAGSTYYRLRQIDFNGNFEYSPIVFVEDEKLHIYPNPTSTDFTVEVGKEFNNLPARLLNAKGMEVWKGSLSNAQNKLEVRNLPAGIYFLHLTRAGKKIVEKIVVQ